MFQLKEGTDSVWDIFVLPLNSASAGLWDPGNTRICDFSQLLSPSSMADFLVIFRYGKTYLSKQFVLCLDSSRFKHLLPSQYHVKLSCFLFVPAESLPQQQTHISTTTPQVEKLLWSSAQPGTRALLWKSVYQAFIISTILHYPVGKLCYLICFCWYCSYYDSERFFGYPPYKLEAEAR